MSRKRDLSVAQVYVLSALVGEDRYGLGIVKAVREQSNYKILLGSLYNILGKLENQGFVESYWGESTPERGGNRRKYYKITGAGETQLSEVRLGLSNMWSGLSFG